MVIEHSQRVECRMRGSVMKSIKNNLTFYSSEKMNEIPGLVHGFSSRHGGVSEGRFSSLNFGLQDQESAVTENYRLAMEALGISMKSVLQDAQQVQESLKVSARECQGTIQEYKKQILTLEKQSQNYQKQYSALNDLISLFIQTTK